MTSHEQLRNEFYEEFTGTSRGVFCGWKAKPAVVLDWFISKLEPLEAENTKLRIENDGLKVSGEMYGRQVAELREWIESLDKKFGGLILFVGSTSSSGRKTTLRDETRIDAALALGKDKNESKV